MQMRLPFSFKASLAALLLFSHSLLAQPVSEGVEMADRLRSDGKIWVVVAVIAAVFAGIIIYLIRLDSQLSKLEKEVKSKSSTLQTTEKNSSL